MTPGSCSLTMKKLTEAFVGTSFPIVIILCAATSVSLAGAPPTPPAAADDAPPVRLDAVEAQAPAAKPAEFTSFAFTGVGAASRVESADIARATGRTLEDVLQAVPGVQARSRAGDDVFLSLRGSGLQSIVFTKARGTDVLIDGIPVNSADGNFDYSLISPLDAASVEVFRGNAAFGLGGATLGGALNLATPTGRELDGGRVRVDAGSFGFLRVSASYGESGENWDAALRYTWQDQDGFRDYNSGDSHKLSASVGHRLGDSLENRLYLNAATVHQEVALPITQTQVEDDPRQAGALNPATRPYFDVETIRLADKLTFSGPDTTAEASVYYMHREIDFRRPSMPATGYQLGPGWLDARTDDVGGQLRVMHAGELFGRDNTFTAGLRLAYLSGEETLHPNVATVKGARFAAGDLTAWNATLWFENEHALNDRLALVAGLKAAYAYREYQDTHNTGAADVSGDRDYAALTPELALRWAVTDSTRVHASLSRSFEPPAFGDLIGIPVAPPPPQRITFRDLDAQEATTLEVGARGAGFSGRLLWEASLYRSWVDDEILYYSDGTPTGNQVGSNADRTIHDGFELALTARLWQSAPATDGGPVHRLSLRGAYTWNDYRFDGDPTFGDNKLAGVPEQTLFGELLYEHPSGFYLGVNVTGIPESYAADNANTYEVNSHTLLGARAGWIGKRLSVFVEGRNLADEAYVAALQNGTNLSGADSAIFFSGPGRSVYAGVEWRW